VSASAMFLAVGMYLGVMISRSTSSRIAPVDVLRLGEVLRVLGDVDRRLVVYEDRGRVELLVARKGEDAAQEDGVVRGQGACGDLGLERREGDGLLVLDDPRDGRLRQAEDVGRGRVHLREVGVSEKPSVSVTALARALVELVAS
jgi:hypothetical protein